MSSPPVPWRAVAALSVTQIAAWGAQYYAISVLAPAIEADTGWSRQAIFSAYSLGLLAQAFISFHVGRLLDRFGGRAVMSVGSVLSAAGLAAVALAPSPATFVAAWVLVGVAMAATQYEPAFATITASFGGQARRAITILTFAGGLASTVAFPATAWLMTQGSWRQAYLVWSAVALLVCLPLHLLLLPRAVALRPPARPLGPVLGTASFWLVASGFMAGAVLFSVMGVHTIPMLIEAGLGAEAAVGIAALTGVMQVAGRVMEFAGLNRLRPSRVAIVSGAAQPIALLAMLWVAGLPWLAWVYVTLYGASAGVLTIVRGTLPVELFGLEGYGAVSAALMLPGMLARAAGPVIAALLYDASGGSYGTTLWLLVALGLLQTGCFIAAARRSP